VTSPWVRVRRSVPIGFAALACAFSLGACGGFDSAASGEHLIRDYVSRFGQGKVGVESVSCPGGVSQKTGGTYVCKVVLRDETTKKDHPGTITIHMAAGNKIEIRGSRDVRIQ
jgi:hypothetical protein